MSKAKRRTLTDEALAGYVHGPSAATEATKRALTRIGMVEPQTLILVEGISDQIAIETLAGCRRRDLEAERVVVLPVGGAQGVGQFVDRFGTGPAALRLVGLCDAAEEEVFRDRLEPVGHQFHVCVADLEDELIRALGIAAAERLLESTGDLKSFRTLQKQRAWQGRPAEAQLRRFFGSGARRKSRYARLLVEAMPPEQMPAPLLAVLDDL